LAQEYQGMTKEKAITLTLLYASQSKEEKFKSTYNKIFSKDMTNSFKMFIQEREYKRVQRPNLPFIFKVIRDKEINITLQQFSSVKVPKGYAETVLNEFKDETLGECLAPWCESYGTNETMKKTEIFYLNFTNYKLASVCTECFIKYGYNRKNGKWEEIGTRIESLQAIGELLQRGYTCPGVREVYKYGIDSIYEAAGYLLYHRLLPEAIQQNLLSKVDCHDLKQHFVELVHSTGSYNKKTIKQAAKRAFGWTIMQFYYYFAFPEVQNYFIFEARLDLASDQKAILVEVDGKIKYYLKNNKKISIKAIKQDLGYDLDIFIRRGLNKAIKQAREKQIQVYEEQLWNVVNEFVDNRRSEGKIFKYLDICNHTGYGKDYIRLNLNEKENKLVFEFRKLNNDDQDETIEIIRIKLKKYTS
jgi:hypothetical protein